MSGGGGGAQRERALVRRGGAGGRRGQHARQQRHVPARARAAQRRRAAARLRGRQERAPLVLQADPSVRPSNEVSILLKLLKLQKNNTIKYYEGVRTFPFLPL